MHFISFLSFIAGCLLSLQTAASYVPDKNCSSKETFQLSKANPLVPVRDIECGGPPKDGIPAIDSPQFTTWEQASFPAGTRALIVKEGSETKVYPFNILVHHEVVNDTIADKPIAVTYCPLCGTGLVFSATIEGTNLTFGVSGLLYNSDVLLYDRSTNSLWSQIMRKAITGPYKGKELKLLVAENLPVALAQKKFPQAKVLSQNTGFENRDYNKDPYPDYKALNDTRFKVRKDFRYHLKTWTFYFKYQDTEMLIPVDVLPAAKNKKTLVINGKFVRLSWDKQNKVFHCPNLPEAVCFDGYWFALRAFHPNIKIATASDFQ